MAWTGGRWPLAAGASTPTNLLTCVNELVSQLNYRGVRIANGTGLGWADLSAFVAGQSTWDAIKILRDKVEWLIYSHIVIQDGTWYQYKEAGASDGAGYIGPGAGARRINIFEAVFGVGRLTWLNTPPATEATSPTYDPLDGDLPYKTYLNELCSVIDEIQWGYALMDTYDDGSGNGALARFYESDPYETSEVDAIDNSWADTPVDTVGAHSDELSGAEYGETNGGGGTFCLYHNLNRPFYEFVLPQDVLACKLYFHGELRNRYMSTAGDGFTANPSWDLYAYQSGTTPGALTFAGDWSYGSLSATLAVAGTEYSVSEISTPVTFSVFDSDQTNYVQLRGGDFKHSYLDPGDAYWDPCYWPGLSSTARRMWKYPRIFFQIAE